ncbi:hypothetical protein PG913_09340 [Tenacibaculum pacificus]|uniref:hypothetical protein n=1 Tax=Tenacibaculum pacificus TaxID=3018314 RepID=UPI0022F3E1E3|nr:hypothetical protein [Tenacibaculum pacificus]WBX73083.1 hypothetical protein PG913_09340 [Tenacibaculum pacificus]
MLIENTDNNITKYQVVNRNTGKPIENTQLLLQNNERRGEKKLHKKLITDKNGFATYISNDRYYNVSITVTSKNDTAIFGNYYLYKQ